MEQNEATGMVKKEDEILDSMAARFNTPDNFQPVKFIYSEKVTEIWKNHPPFDVKNALTEYC